MVKVLSIAAACGVVALSCVSTGAWAAPIDNNGKNNMITDKGVDAGNVYNHQGMVQHPRPDPAQHVEVQKPATSTDVGREGRGATRRCSPRMWDECMSTCGDASDVLDCRRQCDYLYGPGPCDDE